MQIGIILLTGVLPETIQAHAHFPFPLFKADSKTFASAGVNFAHIFQAAEALNHLLQQTA